jgi:hypothetical protein
MSKICNNCGNEVSDGIKFCPHCRCNTFRAKNEVAVADNDIVHRLFYWSYPEGSVLSKAKVAAAAVFAYFLIFWLASGSHPIAIVIAAIFGLATLLVGIVVHRVMPEPNANKIAHNDYGLLTDLKHLFLYWQDANGGYILSKTKIISLAVFLVTFGIGLFSLDGPIFLSAVLMGLIFDVPTFLVGFAIHKLTFKDTGQHKIPERKPKQKKVTRIKQIGRKSSVIPQYLDYQLQLDELNSRFRTKEKSARDLIAKRFEPPQLTYTRFITGVDKSEELFNRHLESAYTMINLADEYSPRIAREIESKIDILTAITEKIDGLTNELIVNENITNEHDVDNLISDMDHLIDSVRDYD